MAYTTEERPGMSDSYADSLTDEEIAKKEAEEEAHTRDTTIFAIAELGLTHEGVGGYKGWGGGDSRPGTGLRAPGMPLYDTRYTARLAVLKNLEARGLLSGVAGNVKTGYSFAVTDAGRSYAAAMRAQGWGVYRIQMQLNPYDSFIYRSMGVCKNPVTDYRVYPKYGYELIKKPNSATGGV
ncbi:MAG: hypothetical protein PHS46_08220 [Candidatus Omnitrophica bacterium]|nr:hypothetical protein [Candidatus Omnitrophota bacterium]